MQHDKTTRASLRRPVLTTIEILFALCACSFAALSPAKESAAAGTSGRYDKIDTQDGELGVYPVEHASLALRWKDQTIYVDPVGGAQKYRELPKPDLILITDIHGDHMDAATLEALVGPKTPIVAPAAVRSALPEKLQARVRQVANGQTITQNGLKIEAVPMYNTTPERLKFHSKGRGNGYVINFGATRVYIAGDTEETPEMRALKSIDVAFVPMNLPYTMDVTAAAKAVQAFKPRIVYPYHYRGSDVREFARLLSSTPGIDVRLLHWYD